MSGMQCLMGVRTDKFVLLVGDRSDFLMGAIVLKTDGSKAYKLGEKTMMLCYGEGGDPVQFSEFIEKNLKLYQMRNSYELSPKSAAHYIRRNLANSLRSRDSYLVFLLLGGFDEETGGGYLTTMDYLGNQFEANYLAQWELKGFGGRFSASIMDSLYKPDMTLEEATAAVKKCISDVKKRCAIALPEFEAFVIDADGTRNVGPIRAE